VGGGPPQIIICGRERKQRPGVSWSVERVGGGVSALRRSAGICRCEQCRRSAAGVCTRSIHHASGIGRDERAGRGGPGEALFNPPPARPPEGKNAPQEGTEKEVGRDF
jgi:hypothetical protein